MPEGCPPIRIIDGNFSQPLKIHAKGGYISPYAQNRLSSKTRVKAAMSSRRHHNGPRSRRRSAPGDRSSGMMAPLARLLLRVLFAMPRRLAQPRLAQSGFILPTVVLLLLVVSLTVGSITLRTFTRTTQAIGDRQQQVIANAASPAIDRAKAKIEYLFSQDERLPSGVPGEDQLFAMMANDDTVVPVSEARFGGNLTQPYLFDGDGGETPLEISNASTVDNAWQFPADSDGDGVDDTLIAYSILFLTPTTDAELSDQTIDLDDGSGALKDRAENLEVRSGPLSTASATGICSAASSSPVQEGWFSSANSTTVTKNFQVNAIAIPGTFNNGDFEPDPLGTVATLEFQQDRQINQGNKWGAWFRNDLEVFPGPEFRWNGAMHTEGNLIFGESTEPTSFNAFLLSSTGSCLNTSAADSEITMGELVTTQEREDNGGEEFIGQVISGRVVDETTNTNDRSSIHVFNDGAPISGRNNAQVRLAAQNDSVAQNLDVADLALDPIRLLAEDVSAYRNPNVDARAIRNEAQWPLIPQAGDAPPDNNPIIDERISNESEPLPRVGDSYRADNRYGPQPQYDEIQVEGTRALGLDIAPGDQTALTDLGDAVDSTEIGLDGYWERRARNQGMRIIMGPRLELGDPYGWDGDEEPLYPFETCTPANLGCHTARQRRTLIDNLGAVQATAIYRAGAASDDGDVPQVCLATTVHPGTAQTLRNSATFESLELPDAGGSPTLLVDFFTGRGTNGWEFPFPLAPAEIPGAILDGEPLGIALRNLTQFAGDPLGGAPSFAPTQDNDVHPYPLMAMWGDFSKQRRILELLDGLTPYDSLSPADKTSLHTAICTIGMLAYNVNYLTQFDITAGYTAELGILNTKLSEIAAAPDEPNDGDAAELFVDALEARLEDGDPDLNPTILALARLITNKEQVNRDRSLGFAAGTGPDYVCSIPSATYPNIAAQLCADNGPRYPILRALFPPGDAIAGIPETANETRDDAVLDAYIANANAAVTYRPIAPPVSPDPLNNFLATDLVDFQPRANPTNGWVTPISLTTEPEDSPNSNEKSLVSYVDINSGNPPVTHRVPFKDAAFFDGRERMSIRALDIDLELLRDNDFVLNEPWLPLSSIVFAFREDAVREDAIVRPAIAGPCASFADFTPANCQTDAEGDAIAESRDPSLLNNGFSMKAVDFIADPDRRPYGFRLFNGTTLKRGVATEGAGLSFISDNSAYIKGTFNVHRPTDSGDVTNTLQEFTTILDDDWGNFYDRESENLDPDFARPNTDDWRPAEVLADAVTILSAQFCDGSIEDTFTTAGQNTGGARLDNAALADYGCDGSPDNRTSYLNQQRPQNGTPTWQRQSAAADGSAINEGSPIVIDRNGNPIETDGTANGTAYSNNFFNNLEDHAHSRAASQTVNLSIISGIVPSRQDQPYGGLHNFPRLTEDWGDVALTMSGTFFQLNFSTAATAPYDQEVWERGEQPTNDQDRFPYYDPPQRLWGYDVAFQYVQAPPIASRFASSSPERSEFYSEPTIDDPYIAQLCRSAAPDAGFCPN